jgi:hypothetical protein
VVNISEFSSNYSFTNKTNYYYHVILYDIRTPPEWIGNPGLGNSGELTLNPNQTQTLYNLKSSAYLYRILRVIPGSRVRTNDSRSGQIKVETCQTINYDIR